VLQQLRELLWGQGFLLPGIVAALSLSVFTVIVLGWLSADLCSDDDLTNVEA
jgi:hypothetical protein